MWEDLGELYITSSTWILDWVGVLGRTVHYVKYLDTRLCGELGRTVHYLKYLDTRLCGRIGENSTLPQVPGY